MKKKILAGLGAVALAFTLSTGALAAHHNNAAAFERLCNGLQAVCSRFNCVYVDADGDGVCDNYGSGNCLHGNGGYIDADNDGVCDNYDPEVCPGNGQGGGCGNGQGGGHHGGGCGNGWGYGGGQGRHGGGHCW